MSLEVDSSAEPQMRTQPDTLSVRFWAESPVEPCLDFWPAELRANMRGLFEASKFVVICNAAIEN